MSRTRLALAILIERYGMDGRGARSLEEVARRRRLPRSTVRQLEAAAIKQIRELAG